MKILENLLTPGDCEHLSKCIIKAWMELKQRYPGKKLGDDLVEKSVSIYGFQPTEDVLWHLTKRISTEAGTQLVPTYSYCRVYHNGAIMRPHVDRESCEYSVSLKISGDDWPLWFDVDGPKSVVLPNGNGVLYKGLETTHWRNEFTGSQCIQAFFHWVDPMGPYAEWRYDKRKYLDQEAVPR